VVTLRGLRVEDVDAIVANTNDPEIARWTSLPQPYEPAHAKAWLSRVEREHAEGTCLQFALESDGRLVGDVNLQIRGAGLAEVGFQLAAGARGRGLMSRALRLAIPWGFEQAQLHVLHWRAEVGNWPSRRVAWAVGFQVVGTVPGLLVDPTPAPRRRTDGWIGALRSTDPLRPAHSWLEPDRILGRGVNLREHREQDIPRMVEGNRDPQSQRWLSHLPADYTRNSAREHLLRIRTDHADGRTLFWAVADPGTDLMLGETLIFIRDPENGQGEVGYWVHPGARGRGVATEAVRLAVRHALLPLVEGGLGLERVALRAAAGNLGSQRVAEKNGFTRTGLDRRAEWLRDGSVVDNVRFDLLADELAAVR